MARIVLRVNMTFISYENHFNFFYIPQYTPVTNLQYIFFYFIIFQMTIVASYVLLLLIFFIVSLKLYKSVLYKNYFSLFIINRYELPKELAMF